MQNQALQTTYKTALLMYDLVERPFDFWFAAQKYINTITNTFAPTDLWTSHDAKDVSQLYKLYQSLPSEAFIHQTSELAYHMWHGSSHRSDTPTLNFWTYAERHTLAIAASAIRSTDSATEALDALSKAFALFSPEAYLNYIRTDAYFGWVNRGMLLWQDLEDWLIAETETINSLLQGSRSIASFTALRR